MTRQQSPRLPTSIESSDMPAFQADPNLQVMYNDLTLRLVQATERPSDYGDERPFNQVTVALGHMTLVADDFENHLHIDYSPYTDEQAKSYSELTRRGSPVIRLTIQETVRSSTFIGWLFRPVDINSSNLLVPTSFTETVGYNERTFRDLDLPPDEIHAKQQADYLAKLNKKGIAASEPLGWARGGYELTTADPTFDKIFRFMFAA